MTPAEVLRLRGFGDLDHSRGPSNDRVVVGSTSSSMTLDRVLYASDDQSPHMSQRVL